MSTDARQGRVAASALALSLCLLTAAGCGGTSKTTSSPASANATVGGTSTQPSTTATQAATTSTSTSTSRDSSTATPKEIATGEAILANYRACLAKYGVDLPATKIGEAIKQPKGVSSQQYTAARQKCLPVLGGQVPVPTTGGKKTKGTPSQSGKVNIPKGTHSVAPTNPGGKVSIPGGGALTAHGNKRKTKVSAKTLAGLKSFAACLRENGINVPVPTKAQPFFVPKGVDTKSPQFLSAETKCLSRLSAH